MRVFMKRGVIGIIALLTVAVFASSAFAIISAGRSEEMVFQSTCDKAGTFEFQFTRSDVEIMARYLPGGRDAGGNLLYNTPKLSRTSIINDWPRPGEVGGIPFSEALPYITLRVSLSALNINEKVDDLVLCKDIVGDNTGFIDAFGENTGIRAVPLKTQGVEVSDVVNTQNDDWYRPSIFCDDDYADVTAYIYGKAGASYFTVYITDIENNYELYNGQSSDPADRGGWTNQTNWPWIKIGLTEDELNPNNSYDDCGTDRETTICVDVSGYKDVDNLATLNVNVDIEPEELTYTTSDSQIGHFQGASLILVDCEKSGQDCFNSNTDEVELCEIDYDQQGSCTDYYQCIIVSGDYPDLEDLRFVVHSMPDGVYLKNVDLYDASGLLSTTSEYYSQTGSTTTTVTNLNCTFLARYYTAEVDETDFAGSYVRICITYQVNTNPELGAVPTAEDHVQFDIGVEKIGPCPATSIADLPVYEGAIFKKCGQLDTCMYFPYLVANLSPWGSGVAITNLSDKVAVEDMEIDVQLRDKDGNIFTGTLPESMVVGKVIAFNIDDLAAKMDWTLSEGNGLYWLWVMSNFPMDGYSFLSDGVFGAGTLPRLLESCDADHIKDIK